MSEVSDGQRGDVVAQGQSLRSRVRDEARGHDITEIGPETTDAAGHERGRGRSRLDLDGHERTRAFDERVDFAYEPPQEIPRLCPKCGRLLLKKDCEVIEELFFSLPASPPAGADARG